MVTVLGMLTVQGMVTNLGDNPRDRDTPEICQTDRQTDTPRYREACASKNTNYKITAKDIVQLLYI